MEKSGIGKRIIITGPESTGKSELTKKLSDWYKGDCIEEYARVYCENLNRQYNYSDILHIAHYQLKAFNDIRSEHPVFFDTYLIVTKIWFNWIYKKYPDWIDKKILDTNSSLYLLCAPDIPWKPDKLRENGGENRIRLFNLYKEELENKNLKYHIVEGQGSLRFSNARNFVEEYL